VTGATASLWRSPCEDGVREPVGGCDTCNELLDQAQPRLRADQEVSRAVVQGLIARSDGRVDEAERLLRDTVEVHRVARVCLVTGDPEVELTSLLLAQGRVPDALEVARRAL
jgi:hypothetical protein